MHRRQLLTAGLALTAALLIPKPVGADDTLLPAPTGLKIKWYGRDLRVRWDRIMSYTEAAKKLVLWVVADEDANDPDTEIVSLSLDDVRHTFDDKPKGKTYRFALWLGDTDGFNVSKTAQIDLTPSQTKVGYPDPTPTPIRTPTPVPAPTPTAFNC